MKLLFGVVALAFMATSSATVMSYDHKVLSRMVMYNMRSTCWGEKYADELSKATMQVQMKCAGMEQGARNKREILEGIYPKAEGVSNYNAMLSGVFSNVTCALMALNFLDPQGNVNIKYVDDPAFYKGTPAAADPVFIKKYRRDLRTCYDISKNLPDSAVDSNPLLAQNGRDMAFFQCFRKVEMNMCAMFTLAQMLERNAGPIDPAQYGAADKYDAAVQIVNIWNSESTAAMKAIENFIWQPANKMW